MRLRWTALSLLGLACLGAAPLAFAQNAAPSNADLLARMKAMEDRIQALESELAQLKGVPAAQAVAAQAPAPAAEAAPTQSAGVTGGAGAGSSKVLNPDVSVIGDFLGATGNPGPVHTPSLQMHESEVGLQAILDPYARADFFISFGETGVEVEEGFLTFPALPGKFELKVGKMRAAFGAVNPLHNHVLPWTDRPLVTNNLVGGEDGIDDAGLSLSRVFAGPGGLFLEGTAQLFRGDSSDVFKAYQRSDVSTVEHFRTYKDLSESTNLNVGFSYARGHSPIAETLINQLYGVDATFRWKPLRRSIYHSFVGRTELIWDHNDVSEPTAFGFYTSGDYQLARRWFLGGRFDRSERLFGPPGSSTGSIFDPLPLPLPHLTGPLPQDTGGSLVVTYWPSEFSQIRGQVRRTAYGQLALPSITTNEFLFQFMFSIGAHGAHPF
jgi:hypothetical protein